MSKTDLQYCRKLDIVFYAIKIDNPTSVSSLDDDFNTTFNNKGINTERLIELLNVLADDRLIALSEDDEIKITAKGDTFEGYEKEYLVENSDKRKSKLMPKMTLTVQIVSVAIALASFVVNVILRRENINLIQQNESNIVTIKALEGKIDSLRKINHMLTLQAE